MDWNITLDARSVAAGRIADAVTDEVQLIYASSDYNIQAGVAGDYVFTITVEDNEATLDYTFTANDDIEEPTLHYYINGKTVTNWQTNLSSDYELMETEAGSGVYTLTITLTEGDDFMFVCCAENDDGTVNPAQYDYFMQAIRRLQRV